MTRRQRVLDALQTRRGEWVPGMDLMNAAVGGTRAGARIMELRRDGWIIQDRRSSRSAVWDYRLVGFDAGRRDGAAGVPRERSRPYRDTSAVETFRTVHLMHTCHACGRLIANGNERIVEGYFYDPEHDPRERS